MGWAAHFETFTLVYQMESKCKGKPLILDTFLLNVEYPVVRSRKILIHILQD
jgi:hypothetical protein